MHFETPAVCEQNSAANQTDASSHEEL